ncbi:MULTISPECIES: DUF3761 domain-containing protein [unclassified Streptomyces]|uniref:DUF3761 domain-containing protein n=1 Tax=unclassified Streptomyces TaxID=2593676 RepID=UPI002F90F120
MCRVASPHPAGATAECEDGTTSYAAKFRGICSHHGRVRYWYKQACPPVAAPALPPGATSLHEPNGPRLQRSLPTTTSRRPPPGQRITSRTSVGEFVAEQALVLGEHVFPAG